MERVRINAPGHELHGKECLVVETVDFDDIGRVFFCKHPSLDWSIGFGATHLEHPHQYALEL